MSKLSFKYLLLVIPALIFSFAPVLHCAGLSSATSHEVSDCHSNNSSHEKAPENSSNDEEKTPYCCVGATSCCVVFVEKNPLSLDPKPKVSVSLFLEDWQQSQAYSLPWKPPKQS